MTENSKKLRAQKMRETLPEGTYYIGADNIDCYTGKEGYIQFKLAMMEEIENMLKDGVSIKEPFNFKDAAKRCVR